MKIRDDALERIADALEKKYEVEPYVDASGVISPDVCRIANALKQGLGVTTETLSNGTILNELIRIAEALETSLGVERQIQVGNTTDEALDRIAYALEEGYGTGKTVFSAFNRIAIALERNYEVSPAVDAFGCVRDGLTRIAYVMENENFMNTYSPPIELIVEMGNKTYNIGDTIDYANAEVSVLRANGKITPVENSDVSWLPSSSYTIPSIGRQMITASYEETEPEK